MVEGAGIDAVRILVSFRKIRCGHQILKTYFQISRLQNQTVHAAVCPLTVHDDDNGSIRHRRDVLFIAFKQRRQEFFPDTVPASDSAPVITLRLTVIRRDARPAFSSYPCRTASVTDIYPFHTVLIRIQTDKFRSFTIIKNFIPWSEVPDDGFNILFIPGYYGQGRPCNRNCVKTR